MQMNASSIVNQKAEWEKLGVKLPAFDHAAMTAATKEHPIWVHFGAGNIFRGFIAALQQRLLNEGAADRGIIAADTFDYDIIDKIYTPYDNLTMNVTLNPDGTTSREIVQMARDAAAVIAHRRVGPGQCRGAEGHLAAETVAQRRHPAGDLGPRAQHVDRRCHVCRRLRAVHRLQQLTGPRAACLVVGQVNPPLQPPEQVRRQHHVAVQRVLVGHRADQRLGGPLRARPALQQGGDDLGTGSVTLGLGGHGDLLEDPSAERPAGQYGPAAGEQQGRTVGVPLVPEPGGGQKGLIRRAQGLGQRRYNTQIRHPRRSGGSRR